MTTNLGRNEDLPSGHLCDSGDNYLNLPLGFDVTIALYSGPLATKCKTSITATSCVEHRNGKEFVSAKVTFVHIIVTLVLMYTFTPL